MNWEAIAAVGEAVGAFGVIASLGYLAVQIRQNTRQIRQNIEVSRVASYNQAQEQTWQVPLAIVQDADSIRAFARFSEQGLDSLTGEEALRVQVFLSPFFHGIDSLFLLYEKGLIDPENWDNIVENQLEEWWSNPRAIAHLRSRPGPISRRLAAHIERRLAERGHALGRAMAAVEGDEMSPIENRVASMAEDGFSSHHVQARGHR